jgi:hypothetical protein
MTCVPDIEKGIQNYVWNIRVILRFFNAVFLCFDVVRPFELALEERKSIMDENYSHAHSSSGKSWAMIIALMFTVGLLCSVVTGFVVSSTAKEERLALMRGFDTERTSLKEEFERSLDRKLGALVPALPEDTSALRDLLKENDASHAETMKKLIVDNNAVTAKVISDVQQKVGSDIVQVTTGLRQLADVVERRLDATSSALEKVQEEQNRAMNDVLDRIARMDAAILLKRENPAPVVHESAVAQAQPAAKVSGASSSAESVSAGANGIKPVEKAWKSVATTEWKSNGLQSDGTTRDTGSVLGVGVKTIFKDKYHAEVEVFRGKKLNNEFNLGGGYLWKSFDFSATFGSRANGNSRLTIEAEMDQPIHAFSNGGELSVVADAKAVLFTKEQVSPNGTSRGGFESSLGLKYEQRYAKIFSFVVETGLTYNSGYNQVRRTNVFGREFNYLQDDSRLALNLKVSHPIRITDRWTVTPSIGYAKDLTGSAWGNNDPGVGQTGHNPKNSLMGKAVKDSVQFGLAASFGF